jgi:hypothetical protein
MVGITTRKGVSLVLSHAIVTHHWSGDDSVALFTENGAVIFFDEVGPGVEQAVLIALSENAVTRTPLPSPHKGCSAERWDFVKVE